MTIKAVFFDCDGTLTKVKSSWEYIHRKLNIWNDYADEYQMLFRQGKIDYEEFCRRDALLWKGLKVAEVMEIIQEIPYQEGAKEMVGALRKMGVFTVILSTGLSLLVEKVREELGIQMSLSNDLLAKDGLLTGETKINVQYDNKGFWVDKILRQKGLERANSCAVGDGEGDRGMFESVGLSIMFSPDSNVRCSPDYTIHDKPLTKVIEIIKCYSDVS